MSSDVLLYALSTCIHCKNTKQFLEESEVEFDHIYVDKLEGDEKKATVNELKVHNAGCSFPTLVIRGGEKNGGKVIIGFHKKDIAAALGISI